MKSSTDSSKRSKKAPREVVVVAQHDLTRRQVLIYTILGQAIVQILFRLIDLL